MQRINVMTWDDSNMAGYDWRWQIFVTKRKDGTFSVGGRQICEGEPAYRLSGIYRLKGGAQLKEGLESLFGDDMLGSKQVDWAQVVSNLRQLDPAVAVELKRAVVEGYEDHL